MSAATGTSVGGVSGPGPFRVSVVVPVYRAARTLERAVASAAGLPEVGEVVLVEDGSPDDSLAVCQSLASRHATVRVHRHPGGENRGAGASRNLGIAQARSEHVAFLDADDWFLPHRFARDAELLTADPTLDGVYNAIGNHYESEALRARWLSQGRPELFTVSEPVPPEELFDVLMWAHPTVSGEFSTLGVTLRRALLEHAGGFEPRLRLQQDTHLWKRLAAVGRLAAGRLDAPVAIRRVHVGNRMTRVEDHEPYRELWWSTLRARLRTSGASPAQMQTFRRAYAGFRARRRPRWKALVALAAWVLRQPAELRTPYGHFDLTLRRTFDMEPWVIRALSIKNRLL